MALALADTTAPPPAASPPDGTPPRPEGWHGNFPAARRWADLRMRVVSASILAPLALACLWVGGLLWTALVAVATVGMFAEWLAMCRGEPAWLRVAGVPYVGVGAISLVWLRFDPAVGWTNVLFVILMVWASDVGAYAFGRLIGGSKLAPAISPGKTWSGAIGGVASAMVVAAFVVAFGFDRLLDAPVGRALLFHIAAIAAALSVVSQAGDLLESAIKRRFGVKDSGRLIPGHGGLLDRLDGMLTAAPAAALLAAALGRGSELWR